MRRSYKVVLSVICVLAICGSLIAQSEVEYKDVVLDGKPAKLNTKTGEITLISVGSKKKVRLFNTTEESKVDTISSTDSSDFHIVKKEETLLDISRKYKVSLTELKRVNNLETTLIDKGQKLRVRNFNSNINIDHPSIWTVSKGDTLYSIAKKNGTSVDIIKKINGLTGNIILVGQILQLK